MGGVESFQSSATAEQIGNYSPSMCLLRLLSRPSNWETYFGLTLCHHVADDSPCMSLLPSAAMPNMHGSRIHCSRCNRCNCQKRKGQDKALVCDSINAVYDWCRQHGCVSTRGSCTAPAAIQGRPLSYQQQCCMTGTSSREQSAAWLLSTLLPLPIRQCCVLKL